MSMAKKLSAIGVVTAAVAVGAWFTVPYETSVVHATYAVDLDTPELAAGWADDVFIAAVDSQESAERDADGLLYTPFRVTVTSTLQGKVGGDIRVVQEGGDDPVSRERVVFDGATALEPGKTYLFATRLSGPDGWHVLPSNFTPVEVPGGATDPAVSRWTSAVTSPKSQDTVHPSDVEKASDPAALYRQAEVG
ncbi:hypothetical protein ADL15_08445 [Actinoplanes awajinensis subsp. mycoplanecinus]|uniref:Uncharacterized protein n=2 Tax=Actinoplanes awajinensis TaxID=135946 RepID=A0A0X3V5I6_9ACTN|nr:hypothetical protein ADL15_08445 [Actinoplanes awajinensis subsp. mycoplanecinus]